ncbi:MAG: class I SAM-dependent methyltransferase [Candidatus Saganbacteria bacterium]|nr:class I SAM-dependent methyltransferase [Candidatus Saganbacteria bacterium]
MIRYYEDLLSVHGNHYRSLDWKSDDSQRIRFMALKDLFYFGKKHTQISVLDLGCGFGDFYGFLEKEGLALEREIRYTGYDISPKILEVARQYYPEAYFDIKDILEEDTDRFDYIFASGIFSIRLVEEEAHLEFVVEVISRLYDLAREGVAVNFLSTAALPYTVPADQNKDQYYYFDPDRVVKIAKKISQRYVLRHDYHPADFTLYLLKER